MTPQEARSVDRCLFYGEEQEQLADRIDFDSTLEANQVLTVLVNPVLGLVVKVVDMLDLDQDRYLPIERLHQLRCCIMVQRMKVVS